jgi:hypothetical protein
MDKNVMIPLSLLNQIIDLLEELGISEYHPLSCDYGNILWALSVKKHKLELRDAYAKILQAADQEERDEARISYLRKKRTFLFDDDEPF